MEKRKRLTQKQLYAIRLLTQFPVTRSYKEMSEMVGVSEATFRNWRNGNELFIATLEERINDVWIEG